MRASIFHSLFALTLATLLAGSGGARAAGFQFVAIPAQGGEPEIKGGVWTPCAAAPGVMKVGPFDLPAAANCPIPSGAHPLVVISHGRGGVFLGHHDLAESLADSGFIVVAINHPGDNALDRSKFDDPTVWNTRQRDIVRTLDFALERASWKASVDPEAVGFFGFSRGGFTGLALAGAIPDWRAGAGLCAAHPEEPMCAKLDSAPSLEAHREPRIRAFVLADPVNLFLAEGVKTVTAPIQLWSSEFGGDGVTPADMARLRAELPNPPEAHELKGAGHFGFVGPCPASLAASAPTICADPPGFDRAMFHRDMNAAVAAFFKTKLSR